jgi:hypothetical protein
MPDADEILGTSYVVKCDGIQRGYIIRTICNTHKEEDIVTLLIEYENHTF